MPARPLSLRLRLLGHLGIVFALGMIALYWAASSYAHFAADRSYDRLLAGSALSIAETLSITPDSVRVDVPYAALDMLAAAPDDRVFYRVIDTNGATVTGYGDLPGGAQLARQGRTAASISFFDADYRGETVRFVLLGRESRRAGRNGWVWVQVGQTRWARSSLARDLTIQALAPIALITLFAFVVVWLSIGRALRPLERIGASLAARDASDLSPIEADVPREVSPLVVSMNGFMERLDANLAFLRNFIADTAHQLRTPLTALLVQIQSASDAGGEERAHSLRAANKSARKLARLVDQLLSDAMVGHRSQVRRFAELDLRKVVAQAVRDTVPLSADADVRFTCRLAAAPAHGDAVMIGEAVKNLIHNALAHGRCDAGEVAISLAVEGAGHVVTVLDRGPGVDEHRLAHVFERFKSVGAETGGAGLGLSIVNRVAESHGGRFAIANRPDGGASASLWLPQ